MRTWVARIALVLVVAFLAAYAIYEGMGGAPGLVRAALPAFPEFPEPAERLVSRQQGEIYYRSETPFDLDALIGDRSAALPTTGVGTLFLPGDASPRNRVPAMVLLHGSGGISPGRESAYGEMLSDAGYAAFVVDYYAPRGVTRDTPYMLSVISITEFDAITDGYRALELLSTHPDIDPERIGVMGFSYGGMAARFAMDERIKQALVGDAPGFAVHVDFYGPCFQNLQSPATTGAALLTLRGTEDASNDLEACEKREAELRALGSEVRTHIYPGAGHAWEIDRPRELIAEAPYVVGCEIEYDAAGHSMIDGQFIVNVPPGTSREERIAVRMSSGDAMLDCVKSGYIVGGDPETKARSDADLLAFLDDTLR